MRIVLIYAPPWKISPPGKPPYPPEEGPPLGFNDAAIQTGDYVQVPYGLLSLAAQALKAGHHVLTFNLANFPWPAVELLVRQVQADLFGLTCLTANRRGVAMMAALIRRVHPGALIVVGGPHVTALPTQMLERIPEIDLIVIGEGEQTFMEILDAMQSRQAIEGIPGTAWLSHHRVRIGPRREFISDLDELSAPLDYFKTRTILTSRGCPGRCTFCASRMMWGRRTRFHSVKYVLDLLEKAVKRDNQKVIAIKDDTFTADRRRAMAICEAIRRRDLQFTWSCDTRADFLDDELLCALRKAGCQRISIGLESASEEILANIRKRVLPHTVLEVTRNAQKYGIQVRYYLMVGNRGETLATFQQTVAFIQQARPNQVVFSQLHLYPGTEEFDLFQQEGVVSADTFFSGNFFCLTCFAGKAEDESKIRAQLQGQGQLQVIRVYDVADCRAIVKRLPLLHTAHLDLCRAYLRAGRPEDAERHLEHAVELDYFLPGIIYHLRACIAALRLDYAAVGAHLGHALSIYPHSALVENYRRWENWLDAGGAQSGQPLEMLPGDSFETTVVWRQPEYPDPYSLNFKCPVCAAPAT